MNNIDKQVTFGTMKGSRMRSTNDLSDEQHGLAKNTARVFVYICKNILSTLRLMDFVIRSSSHTTFPSDNNTRKSYHV
jgi:hypothetical protein